MRAKILKRNSEIWKRNQKIIEWNSNRTDGGQEELEEQEIVDIEYLHTEGLFFISPEILWFVMPDLIRHPGLFSEFRVEPGMICNAGGFILIRNWLSPKKT